MSSIRISYLALALLTSFAIPKIAQAASKYDQAQAALKNGDFTTYASLIQEVGTLIKQAQTQAAAGK